MTCVVKLSLQFPCHALDVGDEGFLVVPADVEAESSLDNGFELGNGVFADVVARRRKN